MNIKEILNIKVDKLTRQEIIIHNYLLTNYSKVYDMTINDLSEELFCSRASIDRYLKKVNINGFKEFKQVISNVTKTNNDYDDIYKLFKKNKDKRIVVVGFGASYISAQYMERRLSFLGYDIVSQNVSQLLGFKQNYSIVVVISNSGSLDYYKSLLDDYKNKVIVSITLKDSMLANASDYYIDNTLVKDKLTQANHDNQIHNFLIIEELFNNL